MSATDLTAILSDFSALFLGAVSGFSCVLGIIMGVKK